MGEKKEKERKKERQKCLSEFELLVYIDVISQVVGSTGGESMYHQM